MICLLAWIYLSLQLKIFPNTGLLPDHREPVKTVSYMMLPWLVLGLTGCTSYARFTRGQMVETLNEDYIRTAAGQGRAHAATCCSSTPCGRRSCR